MSFDAMTWAVDKQCNKSSEKLVLIMLASRTNKKTGQCNPSHQRLAHDCCMSVSSLKVQIKSLKELGYLSIIKNSHNGVSLPNQYQLHIETLEYPNAMQTAKTSKIKGSEYNPPRQILAGGGSDSVGGVGQILAGGGSDSGYKTVIETVNITTTTEEAKNKAENLEKDSKNKTRGGGDFIIIFNRNLSRKDVDKANEMMKVINKDDAQSIADVLSAMIEGGDIRKTPIAALGGLIRRYKAGSFDSTTGEHIKNRRKSTVKNIKIMKKQDSVNHEEVMAELEKMKKKIEERKAL